MNIFVEFTERELLALRQILMGGYSRDRGDLYDKIADAHDKLKETNADS